VRAVRHRLLKKIGKKSATMNAFCQNLRGSPKPLEAWGDRLAREVRSEDGPTTTEYAVLIAVICVAVIGALSSFGVHMDNIYTSITNTIPASGS